MKFLHDIDARQDEKIQILLKLHGVWGYGAFWIMCENLRKNGGQIDMTTEFFYEITGAELQCDAAEAQRFIANLGRIGLFRVHDGKLISDRLVRDSLAYERRVEINQQNANARWNKATGTKIAEVYSGILERKAKIKRSDFNGLFAAIGVVESDCDRLWNLSTTYTKEALGHYTRKVSAHLQANGTGKADFIAYLEKWLLEDSTEKKGYFTHNKMPRKVTQHAG